MPELILNQNQQKATYYGEGPLLVVAGAGTGKTRVITERIHYLLEKKLAQPQEILALTFTEKAAQEMLGRVDEVMPLGYEEPWLSTFHAFAERILRAEGLEIGLDPSYKILTSSQQWLLIRQHLFDFDLEYYRPLGNPSKFIGAMLTLFSRAQDEDVSPEEFLEYAQPKLAEDDQEDQAARQEEAAKLLELAKAYQKYRELKLAESRLDFGDLILWTLRLFRQRSSILAKYRRQFKYLLIDEFQDTNYAQYQLIKLLAPAEARPNLLVVGDDDQSIYKFRGAAVSNILNFKQDYPEAETVVLTRNYRSTAPILKAAYTLIKSNDPDRLEPKLGISKKLTAARSEKGLPPQELAFASGEEEAEGVVRRIVELVSSDDLDYTWRDMAILARANSHLDPFVAALKRAGIPYQLLGNRGLFDQEEVRGLISFLRFLADPLDNSSLFHLLSYTPFGISPNEVVRLTRQARVEKRLLGQVLLDSDLAPALQHAIKKAQEEMLKKPASRIAYDFVMQTGYLKELINNESLENNLRVRNLDLFLNKVKEFEAEAPNPSVIEFVSYLEMLLEAGESPAQAQIEDLDTVNLLTVHSAKGLEFSAVFLVDLVADRFPTRARSDPLPLPDELVKEILPEGEAHLQEERRLFYVGLTRARDLAFLTWAKNYGGVREKRPSGFLAELKLPKKKGGLPPSQLPLGLGEGLGPFVVLSQVITPSPQEREMKYISYSQLEAFAQCPLKYKYRYVLGLPTPPSHVLNFGQTIHRTLRDFHRYQLVGQEATLEDLLRIYAHQWIGEGYDSETHRQERFNQGQKILERYFSEHTQHLGQPLYLEKKFSLRLNSTTLIGSIDRVETLTGGQVALIDYKTGGSTRDQKEVDRDEQLTIYALAAKEALNLDPQKLALYFLEPGVLVATSRTEEEIAKKKRGILEQVGEIRQSEFPARVSKLCQYCDYRHICPEYRESLRV